MAPIKFMIILTILSWSINFSEVGDTTELFTMVPNITEYPDYLNRVYNMLESGDSATAYNFIIPLRGNSELSGDNKTLLETQLMEVHYLVFNQHLSGKTDYYWSVEQLKSISSMALRNGWQKISLRSRIEIFNIYWDKIRNYELAFEYGKGIDRDLESVSTYDFPDKLSFYLGYANLYYYFGDYDSAAFYFKKIIDDDTKIWDRWLTGSAYNVLGLIYRTHYKDLDKSDEMFSAILQLEPTGAYRRKHYDIGEGVATGNLGYNIYLRGDYEKAIPLLKTAKDKMLDQGNYYFAAGSIIPLADIYLEKGDFRESKRLLDLADSLLRRSERQRRWKDLYPVISKYYSKTGKPELSIAYMDSAFMAREKHGAEFNALQLHRAEQTLHSYEQKIKDEEIKIEKERNRAYLRNMLTIAAGLVIVMTVMFMYIALYRKKQRAYRELVHKSREWAAVSPEMDKDNDTPDSNKISLEQREADRQLVEKVGKLMTDEKLHLDSEITLDSLAIRLEVNRVYLSRAINGVTGKNFSAFINEYRIKEAVRIITLPDSGKLSIDQIAYDSGFNDRKTFSRVFRKFTGLSPTELRNNNKSSVI